MGTEKEFTAKVFTDQERKVKLNNPLMGTETTPTRLGH